MPINRKRNGEAMTWAAFVLIIKNIAGYIYYHWQIFGVILLFILVFSCGFCTSYKSCSPSKPVPSIDIGTVKKINDADEANRKIELKKVLEDNANVITTADNRTISTEANVAKRDEAIEAKIKEVDKAIADAHQNGHDVTQQELVCLLQPESCTSTP